MADDTTIIEGTVKFRDGKKWKSRWCVMRKLSPVADCVHLQLYRDSKARWSAAPTKASLSLQHFLGVESGFTLDKHSHTLALICKDFVAVLAFETHERLMQWQVKVSRCVGSARSYVVVVARGGRLGAGPARLLLAPRWLALTAGAPPRLLGLWPLQHLRRYGVVEGRFCFEGGSLCGKGEGLHVLVSEQATHIARDVDRAAQGRLRATSAARDLDPDSPTSHKAYRPDTRLSELNTIDRALPPGDRRVEDACWPSAERPQLELGLADTASVGEPAAARVAVQRCRSCMAALAALSRSSTAQHFSPAWTMDQGQPHEDASDPSSRPHDESDESCRCADRPPDRPPKPSRLELNVARKPPMPSPTRTCSCGRADAAETKSLLVGPYENYDVPRLPSAEVEGEYYDTPKRLKECLDSELFRMTKSSTMDSLVLKKPCGCLLKLGRRPREPTVIDADENFQNVNCPCQRVTDWANNWIKLPYCRRSTMSSDNLVPNKENVTPNDERSALYATIDVSRKTRRRGRDRPGDVATLGRGVSDSRLVEIDDGPLANYENLSFALSLEHYENAKDLLRRAGVTQAELDAITANLRPSAAPAPAPAPASAPAPAPAPAEDYLVMAPRPLGRARPPPAGYTAMSPAGLARPALHQKSASNPALCAVDDDEATSSGGRKRSCSADSSRFLEDVKEFEDSVGSSSSTETLRGGAAAGGAGVLAGAGPARAAPNRDSSSSNDSGVSSWSHRNCELPLGWRGPSPRRSRSTGAAPGQRDEPRDTLKSSSAEAEVPVLNVKPLRGVMDTHSTSSGTSDMSDYIETLSICSSHSSSDTPITMRVVTSSLRPRSGKEYRSGSRLAAAGPAAPQRGTHCPPP